jgi:hypothetical protein
VIFVKSFGIGLALVVSGGMIYVFSSIITEVTAAITRLADALRPLTASGAPLSGVVIPDFSNLKVLSSLTGVPDFIFGNLSYFAIAVIALGVVWYWIMVPILYFTRPKDQNWK